jgi:hypothetical protein
VEYVDERGQKMRCVDLEERFEIFHIRLCPFVK